MCPVYPPRCERHHSDPDILLLGDSFSWYDKKGTKSQPSWWKYWDTGAGIPMLQCCGMSQRGAPKDCASVLAWIPDLQWDFRNCQKLGHDPSFLTPKRPPLFTLHRHYPGLRNCHLPLFQVLSGQLSLRTEPTKVPGMPGPGYLWPVGRGTLSGTFLSYPMELQRRCPPSPSVC